VATSASLQSSSLIKWLQERRLVRQDPLDRPRKTPKWTLSHPDQFLDEDETRQLMAAAHDLGPRHEALVAVLVSTGGRASECAAFRWKSLWRDQNRTWWQHIIGKGGKEHDVKLVDSVFTLVSALHGGKNIQDDQDESPQVPGAYGQQMDRQTVWSTFKAAVRRTPDPEARCLAALWAACERHVVADGWAQRSTW
jgi:integrase